MKRLKRYVPIALVAVAAILVVVNQQLDDNAAAPKPSSTASTSAPRVTPSATDSTATNRAENQAENRDFDEAGLRIVTAGALPVEARETLVLIDSGGPFPYDRDGATFQNREGLLPAQRSGYYEEYTVETPGEDDRGARRIVAGAEGERYYTSDHYDSFVRVDWVS